MTANKWLREALRLAEAARAEDEVPVGAIVVQRERIVGCGYNRREREQNPLAHAELMAIRDASHTLGSWRLTDCILYVTLEPCPMCLAACQQARLSSVVYAAADPKRGSLEPGLPAASGSANQPPLYRGAGGGAGMRTYPFTVLFVTP